jgi:small subunit ribosomal protein S9
MTDINKNSTGMTFDGDGVIKFKGKYVAAVGRRKTSAAKIRVYKNGAGQTIINGVKINQYFREEELLAVVNQPLELTGLAKDLNIAIRVRGGGKKGQAEAIRHGLARALLTINPELRSSLKVKGWLRRDARKKERKKPGLKKARRAPQWAKR